MIEKTVLDYLNGKLNIPVYMEIPEKNISYPFVVIEKTGTSMDNYIKKATFAVQSYAATLYQAAQINETIKETMLDIISLDEVSKCTLNSDYNYTDTSKKRYRYQAIFDLVHY